MYVLACSTNYIKLRSVCSSAPTPFWLKIMEEEYRIGQDKDKREFRSQWSDFSDKIRR